MNKRHNLLSAIHSAARKAAVTRTPIDVNKLAIRLASENAPSGMTIDDIVAAIRTAARVENAHGVGCDRTQ